MTNTDFARENRILDLATKLQLGTATAGEVRQAADSLSFIASERLYLEQRTAALEKTLAFYLRVMKIFRDIDETDSLLWNVNDTGIQFAVMCSDTFDWATADAEDLTPDNIGLLEQSLADVGHQAGWGLALFCARARGRRPLPLMRIPVSMQHLFDAAGPPR